MPIICYNVPHASTVENSPVEDTSTSYTSIHPTPRTPGVTMHTIKPLHIAVGATVLVTLGLSGCGLFDHEDVNTTDAYSSYGEQYGVLVDDASGKIITFASNTLNELEDYEVGRGQSFFIFKGAGAIAPVQFLLDGVVIIDGVEHHKNLQASFSLTSQEVIAYYNQIVDQGMSHEFEQDGQSPADLVRYDIKDRLEMADYDGIMPVVTLIPDGTSTSTQNQSIADSFTAGQTANEAQVAKQDADCQKQTELAGYTDEDIATMATEFCGLPNYQSENPGAVINPEDGSSSEEDVLYYDYDCTIVGLTVNNWLNFASTLNTTIKTSNVRFAVQPPSALAIAASLPCGLTPYTPPNTKDTTDSIDADDDFYDNGDIMFYNGGDDY